MKNGGRKGRMRWMKRWGVFQSESIPADEKDPNRRAKSLGGKGTRNLGEALGGVDLGPRVLSFSAGKAGGAERGVDERKKWGGGCVVRPESVGPKGREKTGGFHYRSFVCFWVCGTPGGRNTKQGFQSGKGVSPDCRSLRQGFAGKGGGRKDKT